MSLKQYRVKRNFKNTPEPGETQKSKGKKLHFVIQRHHASHLHYDFRLEMEGVLKSWAVPKGLSLNPDDKRLAMMVEDHPFEYRKFKGIIPEGNYGAGTVEIWDEGTYRPLEKKYSSSDEKELMTELKKGDLKFILHGKNLRGAFALVNMHKDDGKSWLLIKKKDEFSTTSNYTSENIKPVKALNKNEKQSSIYKEKNKIKQRESVVKKQPAKKSVKDGKLKKNESKDLSFSAAVNRLAKPMLAKYIDKPFDDKNWIFEYKWDGYRTISAIEKGKVKLFSRNHLSQNEQFPSVAKSLGKINDSVIMDGEVVAVDEDGKHAFQLLQNFKSNKEGKLIYYVFDLLFLNGKELINFELKDRKELLKMLFEKYKLEDVMLSPHFREKGISLFEKAREKGMEGIIAKQLNGIYEPGQRSTSWLKVKAFLQQEAIICGYTKPRGSRKKFGSLILGVYRDGKLEYAGHCGSGFDEKLLNEIFNTLQPLIQEKSPFIKLPKTNEKATWVKPELLCEVKFTQLTNEKQFRNPVFKGLRIDKKPKEVKIELPMKIENKRSISKPQKSKKKNDSDKPAGNLKNTKVSEEKINGKIVKLTNLSKLYWKNEKITKGQLVEYYRSVAEWILPYLKDRPESMHRFPNGIEGLSFYQKDVDPKEMPSWIETTEVYSESNDKNIQYLVCQDKASLLYMANLGCIEINPWNSRRQKPDYPDWMVIDLDPGENTFKQVVQVANATKELFDKIKVSCFCKTSGATGLHIYIPTGAKYHYDKVKNFAEIIAHLIHDQLPEITSIDRMPAKRKKKIYVDFLQNRRGQTLAAPYSVRPRAGATVSTPLKWDEVVNTLDPKNFTIFNTLDRISKSGDLWKPVLGKAINLETALNNLEKLQ
jgi:bifunctional non-homologous end joining protein LigD